MKKLNMTVGRFQPMTIGHLNMINEGEGPCIVYRINSSNKMPDTLKGFKVGGRVIKKDGVQHVIDYLNNNGQGDLTEQEKELLKRPFTNELIDKELEIVKKQNKNIIDVIPVVNMFEALARFNKFILDHQDEYEPNLWMCGDDRVDSYSDVIDKYDKMAIERGGEEYENVVKGKLKTSVGKGRTEGVSGTAVRKAIINKDKLAFEKIMPKGVGSMFNDFVDAFDEFKSKLANLIKESRMMTLKDYIFESQSKYFSKKEIDTIIKDIKSKNGKFIDFIDDKVDKKLGFAAAYDDYFNQCLDDDRCTAEIASYISKLIGRENFELEDVQKLVKDELLNIY